MTALVQWANEAVLLYPSVMTGFESTIGLEIIDASSSKVVGEIKVLEHHLQPYGLVHGGVFCSMIETLASYGAAIWANDQGWFGAVGLSNATDFLAPPGREPFVPKQFRFTRVALSKSGKWS